MRRTILTIVATVVSVVLLLQFKTHSPTQGGPFADLGAVSPPAQHRTLHRHHPTTTSAPTAPTVQHTRAAQPRHTATPRTVTATGQTIMTPYGPVQVRIVESDGRLTNVVPVQLPSGSPRSSEIAAGAAPILRSEALRANGARIHIVSGATYTSDGYAQSLQSAIDNA